MDQGLFFEDFDVTCDDGYILNIWHVKDNNAEPKLGEDGK
jgi:hypothetical protein